MSGPSSPFFVLAPLGAASAAEPTREPQRLVGAAGVKSGNMATPLKVGCFATLLAATDLRVHFGPNTTVASAVLTDPFIPQGGRFDWHVTEATKCVSIISVGATEAHVFNSSDVPLENLG